MLRLIELKQRGCLKTIIGNHDDMMLGTLRLLYDKTSMIDKSLWIQSDIEKDLLRWKYDCWRINNGEATLNEFEKLSRSKQEAIIKFLSELTYFEVIQCNGVNYHLAHAEAYVKNEFDDTETVETRTIWGDPYNKCIRYLTDEWMKTFENHTLITGHRIVNYYIDYKRYIDSSVDGNRIIKVPDKKRILMDCGAKVLTDRDYAKLACLRLDDQKEFYIGPSDLIA